MPPKKRCAWCGRHTKVPPGRRATGGLLPHSTLKVRTAPPLCEAARLGALAQARVLADPDAFPEFTEPTV